MPAIDHVFSTAVFHHQAGNLQQAETDCRRVLKKDSGHSESLHLLGVIASESGDQEMAASLISRAIAAAGPKRDYCVNLGLVMSRQGRLEAAAACYRQALQTNAADWKTLLKLGRALSSLGRQREAKSAIEAAVAISGEAEPHFELANQLHLEGDLENAIDHFRAAIRILPAFPEAYFNLGVCLTMQSRLEEAMFAYSKALILKPHYPEALNNYGIALQAMGRTGEAEVYYLQAIHCNPDYIDPRYNLGLLRQGQDHLKDALEVYDCLLELSRQHPEAHNNRGNVLLSLGDPHGAACAYSEALRQQPDHAEAHWNLALVHLLLGRFAEGWRGYEGRLRQKESTPRSFAMPLWDGADVGDARILVHAEQGLGDTLQFVRYAAMVKERCGLLIFECQPPLVRALYSVEGIDQVVSRGADLPRFDYHVPLLSLPRIFGTVEETIPTPPAYITAVPSLTARWRNRIPESADLRVGLVWAGNPDHKNDRNRSVPVEDLALLVDIPGISFYSLQKDRELAGTENLGIALTDFADTAAAIANLDLVISVDTSVAHLAGAMGKPVWTLLPFMPDWRWMIGRDDSPWYPNMRLFRQTEPKNWECVIARVKAELMTLINTRKEHGPVG